ncbi:hypothetical protein MUK42_13740 [Musa troglodytarum]|uniref:Uncharacterized protein n=1 Tax=Musa troglodytarum TaxID=320322 RepID=A0A9E7L996_9LILI|nr:hypothetical protein MUK42_13740 [Musa troglodytarum]
MGGVLVYHLPEWESGRHNLWQRGNAFARLLFKNDSFSSCQFGCSQLEAILLPFGKGRWAIRKAYGLGPRPPLHLGGPLVCHLPKWESGRRNLWQQGYALARPPPKSTEVFL